MLSSAVDAGQGELLRFIPKARQDSFGKSVAVDTRVQADVIGLFIEGDPDVEFTAGDRRNSNFNGRAIRQDAWASVDIGRFASGNLPRKGDVIETIDRVPVRKFQIVDALPDGETRLAFPLVRA